MGRALTGVTFLVLCGVISGNGRADMIAATGSNPNGLSAQAIFEQVGTDLKVTLLNTKLGDETFHGNLLMGLFFDLDTTDPLSIVSATAGPLVYIQPSAKKKNDPLPQFQTLGSNALAPSAGVSGSTISGGWQYRENLAGGLDGLVQTRGLGTAGYGIFQGNQVKAIGHDYGITSAGDVSTTSQAGQLFDSPLVKERIEFVLAGLSPGYSLVEGSVKNVRFQYGTDLKGNPSFLADSYVFTPSSVVPEPGSVVLMGLGLGLLGIAGWRRRQN